MPKRKLPLEPTSSSLDDALHLRLPTRLRRDFAISCSQDGYVQAEKLRELIRTYVKDHTHRRVSR